MTIRPLLGAVVGLTALSGFHAALGQSDARGPVVWPVGSGIGADGHWGPCADNPGPRGCFWLDPSLTDSSTVWRDASPFDVYDIVAKAYHLGADFNLDGDTGKPVRSIADGRVAEVYRDIPSWGNVVFIAHDINGTAYTSMYAHINIASKIAKDQTIERGQRIGTIAAETPLNPYPPHLHFELRLGTQTTRGGGWASQPGTVPNGQVDPIRTIQALARSAQGSASSAPMQRRWRTDGAAAIPPPPVPMTTPAPRPAPAPVPPSVPSPSGPGSTGQPGPEQPGTSVTLRWNAVSGAQDYDLGIRDTASNRLVVDRRVSGTDFTASLAAGGGYRWNVAACNAAGCSAFTAPLHFTLRAAQAAALARSTSQPPPPRPATTASAAPPRTPRNPVPGRGSSPGPEIPGQTITLQWDAVNGATHYDLSLRNMTTRRDMSVDRLSQRFHIARVAKGETYRWSVSACNRTACSEPTDRLYFTAR